MHSLLLPFVCFTGPIRWPETIFVLILSALTLNRHIKTGSFRAIRPWKQSEQRGTPKRTKKKNNVFSTWSLCAVHVVTLRRKFAGHNVTFQDLKAGLGEVGRTGNLCHYLKAEVRRSGFITMTVRDQLESPRSPNNYKSTMYSARGHFAGQFQDLKGGVGEQGICA